MVISAKRLDSPRSALLPAVLLRISGGSFPFFPRLGFREVQLLGLHTLLPFKLWSFWFLTENENIQNAEDATALCVGTFV